MARSFPRLAQPSRRPRTTSATSGRESRLGIAEVGRATPAEPTDEALMEGVREGHQEAFRELLERYWLPLLRYASSMVYSTDAAEDVAQEVFIRVWRKRAAWTSRGSVAAYLYRITRNLSLNARRDQSARDRRNQTGGLRLVRNTRASDPLAQLELASLGRDVEAAISRLPERRREIFVLARYHGLSHSEIAEALQISTQTVANQMSSALADLRAALSRHLSG